ncbi:TPA: hypothetical protein QFC10_002309 [Enterococcus faecium]
MTNVVTNESKVTSDMTLFAKVKSIPEIINTTIEHPITRKDIAIFVFCTEKIVGYSDVFRACSRRTFSA